MASPRSPVTQLQSTDELSAQTLIVPPPQKRRSPLCLLHTWAFLSPPLHALSQNRPRPFSAPALALSPGSAFPSPTIKPPGPAAIGVAQGSLGSQVKVAGRQSALRLASCVSTLVPSRRNTKLHPQEGLKQVVPLNPLRTQLLK